MPSDARRRSGRKTGTPSQGRRGMNSAGAIQNNRTGRPDSEKHKEQVGHRLQREQDAIETPPPAANVAETIKWTYAKNGKDTAAWSERGEDTRSEKKGGRGREVAGRIWGKFGFKGKRASAENASITASDGQHSAQNAAEHGTLSNRATGLGGNKGPANFRLHKINTGATRIGGNVSI